MGDNAGNILVKCFFVLFGNEGLLAFDSKNNVYVKLGIVSAMTFFCRGLVHLSPRWGLGYFVISCAIHLSPRWGYVGSLA